jgi:hypothetical protein
MGAAGSSMSAMGNKGLTVGVIISTSQSGRLKRESLCQARFLAAMLRIQFRLMFDLDGGETAKPHTAFCGLRYYRPNLPRFYSNYNSLQVSAEKRFSGNSTSEPILHLVARADRNQSIAPAAYRTAVARCAITTSVSTAGMYRQLRGRNCLGGARSGALPATSSAGMNSRAS